MKGAIPFRDEDFPGYAAAVAHENLVRGAACLGLGNEIGGLSIMPLTAYRVRQLTFARSPFLITGITPEALIAKPDIIDDIMRFLWIMSPMFESGARTSPRPRRWQRLCSLVTRHSSLATSRDRFNAAYSSIVKQPAAKVCREILDFVEEAYLDAEELDNSTSDKAYFAFELSIAQELLQYGFRFDFWNPMPMEKNPVHVPLKLVFQMRKMRRLKAGEIVSNKSEKFISAGLASLGRTINSQPSTNN